MPRLIIWKFKFREVEELLAQIRRFHPLQSSNNGPMSNTNSWPYTAYRPIANHNSANYDPYKSQLFLGSFCLVFPSAHKGSWWKYLEYSK